MEEEQHGNFMIIDNLIKNKLNKVKNNFAIENLFYQKVHQSRIYKILNQFDILKKSSLVKGMIVEAGVLNGNSLLRLGIFRDYLCMQNKKLIGFDAFGAFPDSYKKTKKKILKKELNFSTIHDKNTGKGKTKKFISNLLKSKNIKNFSLVEGDVLSTIDTFIKKEKRLKISFLHLDMDVYLPTLVTLEKFYNFLSKNAVVVIDDYNTHPGATQATKEFILKKKLKIKVIKNVRSSYYFIKK